MSTQTEVAAGARRSNRHYRLVGRCPFCQKPYHKKRLFIAHIARCPKRRTP